MTRLGQKTKNPKKTKNQISKKNTKSKNFSACRVLVIVFFSLRGFQKSGCSKNIQKECRFLCKHYFSTKIVKK